MLLLSNTETLTLQTLGAGKVDWTAFYADHTSQSFDLNSGQGTVSSIATTTIVGTPVVAAQRQVRTVIVVNRDTTSSAQTVIIKRTVAGADTFLTSNTLLGTGESLEYLGERGWKVLDRQGAVKVQSVMTGPVSTIALGPQATGMEVGSRTLNTGLYWALYMGKSPRYPVSSLRVRWKTLAAQVGTTWAEMGVYIGPPLHGANTMTTVAWNQAKCVGYVDVLSQIESIGNHDVTISTLTGTVIPPGEDVWILLNSEYVTTGAMVPCSVYDDVYSGVVALQTVPSRRPSLDLGLVIGIAGPASLTNFPTFQVYW